MHTLLKTALDAHLALPTKYDNYLLTHHENEMSSHLRQQSPAVLIPLFFFFSFFFFFWGGGVPSTNKIITDYSSCSTEEEMRLCTCSISTQPRAWTPKEMSDKCLTWKTIIFPPNMAMKWGGSLYCTTRTWPKKQDIISVTITLFIATSLPLKKWQ